MSQTNIGRRVRLIRTTDPYTRLKRGDEGVVMTIDCTGTVFVKWDNGSTLGMIREAGDDFMFISPQIAAEVEKK